MIGTTLHTYTLNQAITATQPPAKPVEKPVTTTGTQAAENKQSYTSSLDSLGQGRLL